MIFKHKKIVAAVLFATSFSQAMAEEKQEANKDSSQTMAEVKVKSKRDTTIPSEKTESYTVPTTQSATRMNTSLKETPQSVSVITRKLMDDFHLNNINDVLDYATGIKVERVEPSRNYYTARGSDITNFQIDGVGVPFAYGLVFGDIDTAVYDRIEVLRGANGLLTGAGNPSATINFVRKRPTVETQAKISAGVGSFDYRRLDADVSGKLNESGSVRGRFVAANQNGNSYLDRYSTERNVLNGIIEVDISDQTMLTVGHTYQQHNADGVMWGSLPLLYSDGSKRHYSRSASTAPDWTYWHTKSNISFAELQHSFDNDWKLKAQATRRETNSISELFYVYGNENKSTGAGLKGTPGMYRDTIKEYVADVYLSGPFDLGGRTHEMVIGTTWSRTRLGETESSAADITLSSFDSIGDLAEPVLSRSGNFAAMRNLRLNTYVSGKFNLTDDLKLTLGANMLSYKYSGESYGVQQDGSAHNKVTPYVGAVYALDTQHSVYASYTEIYNPQVAVEVNTLKILAPQEGSNSEIGLKSTWFNDKLNTSVAYFDNKQKNFAQGTGVYLGPMQLFEAIDVRTKGFEFDVSGEVADGLSVNAGFTRLMSVKDDDGQTVKTYIPRNMAHIATTYKVTEVPGLKVGASVNWQDDIYVDIGAVRYTQKQYAVLNLMSAYDINAHWQAAVNLNNVTNEKYLASMMWANYGQSYYAQGANGYATLTWKY